VDVDRSPAVVPLRDARRLQVPVEDQPQPGRDCEHLCVTRQMKRDRLTYRPGLPLHPGQCLVEPAAEVGGEVISDRECIPLPALLVSRVEVQEGTARGEGELPDGQGPQLVPVETGQDESLVDQRGTWEGNWSGRCICSKSSRPRGWGGTSTWMTYSVGCWS
jgi:hypothetical protein